MNKLHADYMAVQNFNVDMHAKMLDNISGQAVPDELKALIDNKPARVGYIVATCCPTTKAHIELARQSIEQLKLDKLIFIIWPFHYIAGFHSQPLESWVEKNGYLPWEDRVAMLHTAIKFENDERMEILECARSWYMESECMFNPHEEKSAFWTGTWYIIRKLQHYFKTNVSAHTEFFFCCGEDQYNPNIYALTSEGKEKVWKDYSITQHLAIHHVYAVPRSKGLEVMEAPTWSSHHIILGEALQYSNISATQIRTTQCLETLQRYCNEAVTNFILDKGYWEHRRLG